MNILGLNFGHDAAVAVLCDGVLRAYVLRERHSRIKHAFSLEFKNIEAALAEAGLRLEDIDRCAITSTQESELVIDEFERFSISMERHPEDAVPSLLAEMVQAKGIDISKLLTGVVLDWAYAPNPDEKLGEGPFRLIFPEYRTRKRSEFNVFKWLDAYATAQGWTPARLGEMVNRQWLSAACNEELRHGFHYPVSVRLGRRTIPGCFISHHMAHAASTYYQSGFTKAAIFTQDGCGDIANCKSGLFCLGEGHKIHPLGPHYLTSGAMYENLAVIVHSGRGESTAGKLMGLASYGRPRFFDHTQVGNWYDAGWKDGQDPVPGWGGQCHALAHAMGYDLSVFKDRSHLTSPINADVAASMQKLFEETALLAVETLSKMLHVIGHPTANLCLSGGSSLNCPTNTRLWNESRFTHVYVEPGCDDGGLAIGAASYLHHNLLGGPLLERPAGSHASPYLGLRITGEQVQAALAAAGTAITFVRCEDAAAAAAEDLAADRIIGWFEGRSEIGPRALGHRSILADPRKAENWPRVNRLKVREAWRPLAPAVLAAEAAKWFSGAPLPSPYMLFNAQVRSRQLPAVTHVDGTARIQTVDASCGEFFRLLTEFFKLTDCPVVLNTSFNGPGEPIVESPTDALNFLLGSSLDVLYLEGFRVVRAAG